MIKQIYLKKHFYLPKVQPFLANTKNTCIVSVVNDSFAKYFKIFAKSIINHNPNFEFNWVIFHGKKDGNSLSEESMHLMMNAYKNITFKEIDEKRYIKFESQVPSKLFAALFKFELFLLKGYSKVICLDVDTLCLGDLSYLFDKDFTLAVSLAGGNYKRHVKLKNYFKRKYAWNSGIMVFGKDLLNRSIYNDLMSYKGYCETADQTILTEYFKYFPKYLLPFEYNFHATIFNKYIEKSSVKILHFAGPKPDREPDLPQMKYWIDAEKKYR